MSEEFSRDIDYLRIKNPIPLHSGTVVNTNSSNK
jgi:hypothetical protein